jgi:hypothetical protein
MSKVGLSGKPVAFELPFAPADFCPAAGPIVLFDGAPASLDFRSRCPLSAAGVDLDVDEGPEDDEEKDDAGDVPAGDVAPC